MKTKNMTSAIGILMVLIGFTNLYSVEETGISYNKYQMQPEVWHPVKPEFGQVDSKGDLNLQIPVLTVPGRGSLNFPIVFQYHSGITVEQSASWIGLGWEWDPGSITRDVKGSIIKSLYDPVMGVDFPATPANQYNEQYAHDIYYLHMDGSTTPFYKRYEECSAALYLYPINAYYPGTWRPIKIDSTGATTITVDNKTTSKEDYTGFVVTREDGIRYVFLAPTLAYYMNLTSGSAIPLDCQKYISTWRLVSILGTSYTNSNLVPTGTESGEWVLFNYNYSSTEPYKTIECYPNLPSSSLLQLTYLNEIITPTHKAVFTKLLRTAQDGDVNTGSNTVQVVKRLEKIQLYNRNDLATPIKTVNLEFDAIPNNAKTILKSVSIYGDNPTVNPMKYNLEYYVKDDSGNDIVDPVFAKGSNYLDDYGFLNKTPLHIDDLSSPKAWSLKKIVYPTGGNETFYYENDSTNTCSMMFYTWAYPNSSTEGTAYYTINNDNNRHGGVRVQKITRSDGMSTPVDFLYEYGAGYASAVPFHYLERQDKSYGLNVGGARGHSAVYYNWVAQRFPDQSKIATYYKIGSPCQVLCWSRDYSGYFYISVLQNNNDWNWGTVLETQYLNSSNALVYSKGNNYNATTNVLSKNGFVNAPIEYCLALLQLKKETEMQVDANPPNYSTSKITNFDYDNKTWNLVVCRQDSFMYGNQKVIRMEEYDYAHQNSTYSEMKTKNMLSQKTRESISYKDPSQEVTAQASVEALQAYDPLPQKDSTDFTVNFVQRASFECTLSDDPKCYATFDITQNGTNIVHCVGGPDDPHVFSGSFVAYPDSIYWVKATATAQTGTAESNGSVTYYTQSGCKYELSKVTPWKKYPIDGEPPNIWKPHRAYQWVDNTPPQAPPIFDAYGSTQTPTDARWILQSTLVDCDVHGNPILETDANNTALTTWYGYTSTLPIMSRLNGNTEEFGYASFENNDRNGWSTQGVIDSTVVYSGKSSVKVYTGNGDQFGPTQDFHKIHGLRSNVTYKASVWVKGPATAYLYICKNNATPSASKYAAGTGNWELLEVQLQTTMVDGDYLRVFVANNSSTPAYFDDLRFYPYDGLMATYVYDPKTFNIMSQSDANNIPTFFTFDGFDRLIEKKNADLVKTADYAYYLSRNGSGNNDTFNPNDPNYVLTHQYPAYGISMTQKTYYDGLGNGIQTQTLTNDSTIITRTDYNNKWLVQKQYKPRLILNANLAYSSTVPGDWLYEEFEYETNPLDRVKKQYHYNRVSDKEYYYGIDVFNSGATKYQFTKVTDENDVISQNYQDVFGNQVAGISALGVSGIEAKWQKLLTVLGSDTLVKPPNVFNPPRGTGDNWQIKKRFNTANRMIDQTTPDDGTTRYVYDNNGNLILERKAAQGNYFTVYKYDAYNRLIQVSEEMDQASVWPPAQPYSNYGNDADEWKIKYTYDINQVTGAANFCQGKLTKVEMNQNSDNNPEDNICFVYDKFGLLAQKAVSLSGQSTKTMKFFYDNLGREIEIDYPSGNKIFKTYDTAGRLKKIYAAQSAQ